MKGLASFLISILAAAWLVTAAIVSVQNYTPVSLRFLNQQSFEMPLGLVLAFSTGVGLLGATLVKPLLRLPGSSDNNDE
jgi:uncharacterized integral membrane protein